MSVSADSSVPRALKVAASAAAAGALTYAALRAAKHAKKANAKCSPKAPPAKAAPLSPVLPEAIRVASSADEYCEYLPADRGVSSESEVSGAERGLPTSPGALSTLSTGSSYGQLRRYCSKHSGNDFKIQKKFMDVAVDEARSGLQFGEGGPFGAAIVKNGKVVARAHNMVLQTNDPTAHAEVTCIRKAAAKLGRFDLSDCTLYTSCEPCPMCFGAIHWAKIPVCVYAADRKDAAAAGFDDEFIYDAIKGTAEEEHVQMIHQPNQGAVDVFKATFDQY